MTLSLRHADDDTVVVTGLALSSPFGRNRDDLWTLLSTEQRRPPVVSGFDVEGYRAQRAHLHWSDRSLSSLAQGTLDAAQGALGDAKIECDEALEKSTIGLALGSVSSITFDDENGASAPEQNDAPNALGQQCYSALDLNGPLLHVASACTSSAAALFWAKTLLDNGDADIMIAGGADRIRPVDFAGFNVLRAMDPEGARPFHTERHGITMGEGACLLVLERLSHALQRGAPILARFSGGGLSSDAHHPTAPRGEGMVAAGQRALSASGLQPQDIQYVNCHGTGTPANDSEELKGLQILFGDHLRNIQVGSTKGFTGHWLGSSGALEAAISILVLDRQHCPPMPWLKTETNILSSHVVSDTPSADEITFLNVMSNSLGFGGNNASLVFSHPSSLHHSLFTH